MNCMIRSAACALAFLAAAAVPAPAGADDDRGRGDEQRKQAVQLGPRPFFLVDDMAPSRLKSKLESCSSGPFRKSDFSIGHRGAALQFPEHTQESYEAAARMGAGILECDVTFTKDKELVCRHAQCDLHTTTNILATPLAAKCKVPFTPAVLAPDGSVITPASALCCASDLTAAEFKSLRGKMDDFDRAATTVQQFMRSTVSFRTDLYAGPTSGTLLTHEESIALFKQLGVKMTPELKEASPVAMPFDGFTQQQYAQKMIDEYKAAGVAPRNVFPQSFNIEDVRYWVKNEPQYGKQAVFLDDANSVADLPSFAELSGYKKEGIHIWAPPLFALLADDGHGNIVASQWSKDAKDAGLDIITWTLERSGILADGNNGFYYQTYDSAVGREGDMFRVIDALAKDVGVLGIFSDWAATTTYYASCMGLR
jgi:glycerophosphoryl diester phosphodiesterase